MSVIKPYSLMLFLALILPVASTAAGATDVARCANPKNPWTLGCSELWRKVANPELVVINRELGVIVSYAHGVLDVSPFSLKEDEGKTKGITLKAPEAFRGNQTELDRLQGHVDTIELNAERKEVTLSNRLRGEQVIFSLKSIGNVPPLNGAARNGGDTGQDAAPR